MVSAMKVMMSVAIFAALSGCVVADVAGAGLSAGGAAVKTGVKVGGATAKAGAGVIGAAWAARFVMHGIDVKVSDPNPEAGRIVDEILGNA
ncbi:MAG: hypothetical protein AAFY22_05585, partial [Pseudomonadota bacterium]